MAAAQSFELARACANAEGKLVPDISQLDHTLSRYIYTYYTCVYLYMDNICKCIEFACIYIYILYIYVYSYNLQRYPS